MNWKKIIALSLSGLTLIGFSGCGQTQEVQQKPWKTQTAKNVSVHDPSIIAVKNEKGEKEYYIFGSHIAEAKSSDLMTWEVPFKSEYENPQDNILYGNLQETLAESFKWAGYDDADHVGSYAVWAPDVVWNPSYKWKNGSKGAYTLYYSASSTWRRSCIGFVVSKNIEGPYQYGGTVVYSGFSQTDSTDGSSRNINYENTNLKKLIDDGKVESFNEKWVTGTNGNTYNTDYAPNAIDATVFYDKDGKLWMTYGSWSGGIYLLEMNAETGMPIYPGKDSETEDGRVIDRYFGIKLAGGFHQSGEGPYIEYDEETGYYYLYITYGGLAADGGYNMRLFRAEKPEGPYLDSKGNTPIFGKNVQNTNYGIKIMGNYKLDCLPVAYMSAGHNSALIDDDGQRYLVYHTRFNTGAENHEVRVHQMFMNKEKWPVTAVYAYSGDTMPKEGYKAEDVAGRYQFIDHGLAYGRQIEPTLGITLEADGTITGDKHGTWTFEDNRYVKLEIDGVTYSGVAFRQKEEGTDPKEVMTFSAIGNDNHSIWGSKVEYTEEEVVDLAMKNVRLGGITRRNLTLPTQGTFGVNIVWESKNPEWISNDGVLQANPEDKTEVTLTAVFALGTITKTKDYTFMVAPS